MPASERVTASVERHYGSSAQHHNPIEMLSTTAACKDGKLTIREGTQSAGPMRAALAKALRLDPDAITVKGRYVGGAFGQKGRSNARPRSSRARRC